MRKRLVIFWLILSLLYCPGCVVVGTIVVKQIIKHNAKKRASELTRVDAENVEKKEEEQKPVEPKKEPVKTERTIRASGRDDFTSAPPIKE